MSLSPGTRFGPYEIADEIGAGGMGVVYRATDTTLDREVAIKVLPETMASDAERVARFDREAKTLASLNHPNIAQIHGLEKADGTTAIIMELVEGPTLADRLEEGALSADEALTIALQIAEALEAAHGRGIVHRDLKPANVKLRSDGTVKVLDFGIAKALERENLTTAPQSPILTTPATQVGVILGTAAYMSPEQAKGKQIDQRTDIWAFGCLLYEMLTGQMAFGAEDVPTTLARVIDRETDVDSLPASISPAVRQTIRLCLQKDAGKRVSDIRDVRLALEGAFETVSPQVAEAVAVQPLWRRALPLAAAVLVTAVLVGLGGELLRPVPDPATGAQRWTVTLDETAVLGGTGLVAELDVSPDGSHLAYVTGGTNDSMLYIRRLDQFESTQIAGTRTSRRPFFSENSDWVGFFGMGAGPDGGARRVAVRGGPPQTLNQEPGRRYGGSWSGDQIVLSQATPENLQVGSLYRHSANGGLRELLLSPEAGQSYVFPDFLPGGNAVLFTIRDADGDAREGSVAILSLETMEYRTLIEGGYNARYAPTGHIVFARESAIWAVPFDLARLETTGSETPVVEGVQMDGALGGVPYGFSDSGLLAYVRGGDTGAQTTGQQRTFTWVNREGVEQPLALEPRFYLNPRLSPDSQRLAVTIQGAVDQDVFILDLVRGTSSRLTFDPTNDQRPVWTPDGEQVVYWSAREEGGIFRRAANGTGEAERLTTSEFQQHPETFTSDGTLIYRDDLQDTNWDLRTLSMEPGSDSQSLLPSALNERFSSLSPDGRWLAYVSGETGVNEVYVRPYPNVDDDKIPISRGGGDEPLWSPDGSELFYLRLNDDQSTSVLVVSVSVDPRFSATVPAVLFTGDFILGGLRPNWDISTDGQRFLMMRVLLREQTDIAFVNNWFEELNRLAPPSP